MEFWLKAHYVYFSTWHTKLPGHQRQKKQTRSEVKEQQHTIISYFFLLINTALHDTSTMKFNLQKKILVCLGYNTIVSKM